MTKAYLLGFVAAQLGRRHSDCPYYETMEAFSQWMQGYDDSADYWDGATDELDKS